MVLILSLFLIGARSAAAEVVLPAILSDHMVLQRDQAVPIWGQASPGEKVTVTFGDQSKTTHATSAGKWRVELDPLAADAEPRTLTVQGSNKIEIRDVLVGEVWLCSGQSNMFLPLAGEKLPASVDAVRDQEAIAAADRPTIRLNCDDEHNFCGGGWKLSSPETVQGFSAVAYYFGRDLQDKLKVPIGLISRTRGGTSIQLWMPREVALGIPTIQRYSTLAIENKKLLAEYNKAHQAYHKSLADKSGKPAVQAPEALSEDLMIARSFGREGQLYEKFIAPLVPYGLRGVIWYQGESNSGAEVIARSYGAMLQALISSWREAWGAKQLPFGIVQLPNWQSGVHWPWTREAQLNISRDVPNTGLAVTIDLGDALDLHPKNKKDVARRLSLWALGAIHGETEAYASPQPESYDIQNGRVSILFKNTEGGLRAQKEPLAGFEISGADHQWQPATAQIEGNRVSVFSAAVPSPVAVRYLWASNPEASLYNGAGLPATPFRTNDKSDK